MALRSGRATHDRRSAEAETLVVRAREALHRFQQQGRQLTDELMFEIRELSGQEYTNTYAPKKGADVEVTDDAQPALVRQAEPVG